MSLREILKDAIERFKQLNEQFVEQCGALDEELRNQMNDELKKGKKKIDLLLFNKGKQFSFEDLRDNKNQMMDDDNNKITEEPIMEEEQMIEESSDEDKKETNDNTYHDNFNEANDTFNKDEIIEDKKEQE